MNDSTTLPVRPAPMIRDCRPWGEEGDGAIVL